MTRPRCFADHCGPETGAIPVCEELDIGFVPWSPLGVGFLNGAIDAKTRFAPGDIRGIEGRFAPENLANNLALVKLLSVWAERKQARLGQIALAWLLARKPFIVPIPGTTQVSHMIENIGSPMISFSSAEIADLNAAVAAVEIKGKDFPPRSRHSRMSSPLRNPDPE